MHPKDTPVQLALPLVFPKRTNLEYMREWRAKNRDRLREYNRAWKEANPERVLIHRQRDNERRKSDPVRRERMREYGKIYRATHKASIVATQYAWVERNREHLRTYQASRRAEKREHLAWYRKEWRADHPEAKQVYNNRRRKAPGFHTVAQWRELKARHGFRCLFCGKREPDIKLTEDHVVPLSLGGSNDIDNIQPLCKSCNSSKRGRHIDYRLPVARSHCEIDQ